MTSSLTSFSRSLSASCERLRGIAVSCVRTISRAYPIGSFSRSIASASRRAAARFSRRSAFSAHVSCFLALRLAPERAPTPEDEAPKDDVPNDDWPNPDDEPPRPWRRRPARPGRALALSPSPLSSPAKRLSWPAEPKGRATPAAGSPVDKPRAVAGRSSPHVCDAARLASPTSTGSTKSGSPRDCLTSSGREGMCRAHRLPHAATSIPGRSRGVTAASWRRSDVVASIRSRP